MSIKASKQGRAGIRISSSSAESISHEWAKRTCERYFQHEKIKFVSPSVHVMFCLFYRYWWNSYIKHNLKLICGCICGEESVDTKTYPVCELSLNLYINEKIKTFSVSDWGRGRYEGVQFDLKTSKTLLRANVCNFRKSVDSREFLNFFIFCPNNLYSTLISKITLKLVTAFYFFPESGKVWKTLNRRSFEYEISEN